MVMERNIVGYRLHIRFAGIYYVVDFALIHEFENFIVCGKPGNVCALQTETADDVCRTLCKNGDPERARTVDLQRDRLAF